MPARTRSPAASLTKLAAAGFQAVLRVAVKLALAIRLVVSRVQPLLIIAGLSLCLVPDPVFSAEPQTAEASADETTPASPAGHHANPREVALGFGMLAAILIFGVLLLLVVVLWGNRTRRLARSPLPPVTKQDELWYLKPKKPEDEPQAEPPGPPPGPVPPQPG